MSASEFLSRLEKVRETSRGNWVACCPSHPDKHPSLTISEADDGRVLVHCFAGCSVESVLNAVGLDFDALFPPKPIAMKEGRAVPARLRFNARDVLEAVCNELSIVVICAGDLTCGEPLSDANRARLVLAAERIAEARRLVSGN